MSQTAGLLFRKIRNVGSCREDAGSGRRALARPRRFSLRTGPGGRAARAGRGTFEDTLPPVSAERDPRGQWWATGRKRAARGARPLRAVVGDGREKDRAERDPRGWGWVAGRKGATRGARPARAWVGGGQKQDRARDATS